MKIKLKDEYSGYDMFNGQYVGIDNLLSWSTSNECSDLFVKVGDRPFVNRYGRIIPLNVQPINQVLWDEWFNANVSSQANAKYVRDMMYDTGYVLDGNRYRLNLSYSEGQNLLTARMINPVPPKFTDCGGKIEYPEGAKECLKRALSNRRGGGLVIFSAPTGSGKSTTMGACINSWGNSDGVMKNCNVITLEDPIEYVYKSNGSFRIVQKELDQDFVDFPSAIKSSLREHPQIIIVGECRGKDTIVSLIEAARTGHLVMTTFHCRDIASTVTRLIDNFSDSLADGVDLISNISLIVCQRLEPRDDGKGYELFVEYCAFDIEVKRLLIDALKRGDSLELVVEDYLRAHERDPLVCGRY